MPPAAAEGADPLLDAPVPLRLDVPAVAAAAALRPVAVAAASVGGSGSHSGPGTVHVSSRPDASGASVAVSGGPGHATLATICGEGSIPVTVGWIFEVNRHTCAVVTSHTRTAASAAPTVTSSPPEAEPATPVSALVLVVAPAGYEEGVAEGRAGQWMSLTGPAGPKEPGYSNEPC